MPCRPLPPTLADARLTIGPALTPMAFVNAIVQAYARQHLNPSKALAWAQIAPAALADPAARITAAQMERISGAAMQ